MKSLGTVLVRKMVSTNFAVTGESGREKKVRKDEEERKKERWKIRRWWPDFSRGRREKKKEKRGRRGRRTFQKNGA